MTQCLQLLVLLVGLPRFVVSRSLLTPTRLVAEVASLVACPGVVDNALIIDTPIISSLRGRGNYTFNGAFNITREVRRIGEIRFDMTRCRDVVSTNTCEHFHSWRLQRNACKTFMDPDAPWSTMSRGISEDYGCPTKQGIYHFKEASLDMKTLNGLNLPLEGAVWRTKMFFLEPAGSVHYCLLGEFMFHRTRA